MGGVVVLLFPGHVLSQRGDIFAVLVGAFFRGVLERGLLIEEEAERTKKKKKKRLFFFVGVKKDRMYG